MTTGNIVMCETRLSIVGWVYSKTSIFLATLRTENQPRVESYVFLEAEHLTPFSWMCKKQTSVSHSSTESEIVSLDAGLRMDGLLALDLWDVVIEVLSSTNSTKTPIIPASGKRCETGTYSRNTPTSKHKGDRDVDQLSNVDYVTKNTHSFSRRVSVVHF